MPTTAIIGAVGSIAGAGISAAGASSAANTQANAANNASAAQLSMFNQISSNLAPYRAIGTSAIPTYSALLGLPASGSTGASTGAAGSGAAAGTPDWNAYLANNPDLTAYYNANAAQLAQGGITSPQAYAQWHYQNYGQNEGRALPTVGGSTGATTAASATPDTGAMETALENTPGYQFTKQQGEQAVTNGLSAQGLGGVSGSLGKGLARFVTGLADNTYQQQVGNYANAVGVGQSAANQTGAFGQSATSASNNALLGGATASASGTVGATNAASTGINGAYNSLLTSQILGMYGGGGSANPFTVSPTLQASYGGS